VEPYSYVCMNRIIQLSTSVISITQEQIFLSYYLATLQTNWFMVW